MDTRFRGYDTCLERSSIVAERAARSHVFAAVVGTVIIICLSWFTASSCAAQAAQDSLNALKRDALKVYLDCEDCDDDYIRTEITFVNYVRDRKEAQVHILITTQRTGSGGREYTLTFIGQQNFAGWSDTLTYASNQTNTEDEIRRSIVQTLKLGLIRYVAKTPLADQLAISFRQKVEPTAVVDRWNNWVFSINVSSFLDGQRSSKGSSYFGSFSANRTTLDWKIRSSMNANRRKNSFTFKIDSRDTTLVTISKDYGFRGLIVKSLAGHWSAGINWSVFSSTFTNTKLRLEAAPAIEYNLFPYSESTRRELRVLYRVGSNAVQYEEETIFNKTSETLFNETLSVTLEMKQPWGSVQTTVEGSHYLHDFSKSRLTLFGELSFRLFKGLSFNGFGNISRIYDQLSLAKRGITTEEALRQTRQQATSYRYFTSLGLSYTFGSIYSNVVNPRFGNPRFGF